MSAHLPTPSTFRLSRSAREAQAWRQRVLRQQKTHGGGSQLARLHERRAVGATRPLRWWLHQSAFVNHVLRFARVQRFLSRAIAETALADLKKAGKGEGAFIQYRGDRLDRHRTRGANVPAHERASVRKGDAR